MRKGEIIYCSKYQFPDGGQDDKLIINLNGPGQNEPYLLLLATSQQGTRLSSQGCHSGKGYYTIPKNTDFFVKDFTWILFYTLREFNLKEELKESWSGNFITKGFLKDETLRAIINCLKASNYINKLQSLLLR